MNKINIPVKIGAVTYNIKPYCTTQEKEILLYSNLVENLNEDLLTQIFEVLRFEHSKELSFNEKIALLYKYRSISVGDDITLNLECQGCQKGINAKLIADNFVSEPAEHMPGIKILNKTLTHDNANDFLHDWKLSHLNVSSIDDLELDLYDKLFQDISNSQYTFNFKKDVTCYECNTKNTVDLGDITIVVQSLSENDLISLYRTYHNLIYYSNFSKHDIDTMLPFERSMFIELLNKENKEQKDPNMANLLGNL